MGWLQPWREGAGPGRVGEEGPQRGGPHERLEEGLALTRQLARWPGNQGVERPRVMGRECSEKEDMVSHAMCYCEQGCAS